MSKVSSSTATRNWMQPELGLFIASATVYQGGRFVFSLAAAATLDAADFTAWALIVAVLAYVPAVLLGVTNGMARELPIFVGRGERSSAERSVAATWAATIAATVALLTAGAIVGAAVPAVTTIALVIAGLASATVVFGTQQFILRSELRFSLASVQLALFGGVGLTASVVLAIQDQPDVTVAGLLYGASLIGAILVGFVLHPRVTVAVDPAETRRLASVGFPIMLAGVAFSLFVTLDRWIAATIIGAEEAAPYALASLLTAAMLVIPSVVSQHTYPRMAMALGHGASPSALRDMAKRQGLTACGFAAPVAGAIILFAWLGIPSALPQYAEAVPAVSILTVGYLILAYSTGYGNYLNVIGSQWQYLRSQLVSIAIGLALMVIGAELFGTTGVAAGMAGSHIAYALILRRTSTR